MEKSNPNIAPRENFFNDKGAATYGE